MSNSGIIVEVVTAGPQGPKGDQGLPGNVTGVTASQITDSTTAGRTLITAADATAQRTALGLGTAATTAATAYATAAQGALADTAVQPATLASGLAGKADLVNGLVPSAQLPAYVDDVLEFSNVSAFPATGESGKIYISLATGRSYRWASTIYVEIIASPGTTDAVPEGSVNLYYTTWRVADWWQSNSSTAGRALVTAASAAAQRTALGLAAVASSGSYIDLINKPTAADVGAPSIGLAAGLSIALG